MNSRSSRKFRYVTVANPNSDESTLIISGNLPKEYFADYLPHYPSLVTMSAAMLADGIDDPPNVGRLLLTPVRFRAENSPLQPPIYLPQPMSIPPPTLTHHAQTILSLLLSLKKKPVIRWEKMSSGGKKLAMEVQVCLAGLCMKEVRY